ncbi:MAG: hypothetical protein ACD_73C00330G0003 [uncultured bacterium]|nr:MAG: hypothetical protein ACD_73C00330G0003 [uncultured bacterium]
MSKDIGKKCIWNFHGPRSSEIAQHFLEHTKEFFSNNHLTFKDSTVLKINDYHHQACLFIDEALQETVQKALKPHEILNLP